jgi:hypothetical protein
VGPSKILELIRSNHGEWPKTAIKFLEDEVKKEEERRKIPLEGPIYGDLRDQEGPYWNH